MFRSTSLSHCTPTFVTPGLDPGVHRIMVSCEEMDCRVKPGKDDRKVACKRTEHALARKDWGGSDMQEKIKLRRLAELFSASPTEIVVALAGNGPHNIRRRCGE